jgi:tetratricopeptide (TPR) repeat protein
MACFGRFLVACAVPAVLAVPLTNLIAGPPAPDPESAFQNTLIVQQALEQARFALLQQGNAKKAVLILEEHLPRINGNAAYLRLLRDAYRGYVKDLYATQDTTAVQKYLARLSILDRDAANDPSLRPPTAKAPAQNKGPIQAVGALADKSASLVKQLLPRPDWLQPKSTTVRAKIEEDPFDLAYKHGASAKVERGQAEQLLARAEAEYSRRRFSIARDLYDQAHQADPAVTADCRSRWAYCKLNFVVEQINGTGVGTQALPDLKREVQAAMEMSPGLKDTGTWLMGELDRRGQQASAALALTVEHGGRDAQGWQVAETAHFRIHHQQTRDLAEKVGRTAERTRLEVARKWFGNDGPDWNPKCDIFLHANGQDYFRATGYRPTTPGHADIESERGSGRVLSRRIHLHCDVQDMIDGRLPHETTHVVLAGQFGRHPLPRWADEGMAVLSEPEGQIKQHRSNLVRGELFGVRELVQLPDWPNPRRVSAFYAQSVYLVDFLTRQRGPRAFTEFLRDGLQGGYEQALEKHYGIRGFNDLQNRWQQVLAEMDRMSPGLAAR